MVKHNKFYLYNDVKVIVHVEEHSARTPRLTDVMVQGLTDVMVQGLTDVMVQGLTDVMVQID